jgi:hypothetical protein
MEGKTGKGQIDMTLHHSGTEVTGQLIQTIDPWTGAPPLQPEDSRAAIVGRLYLSEAPHATLIELVRVNERNPFTAICIGIVSADGTAISGQVVNNRGAQGSFVMQKVSESA